MLSRITTKVLLSGLLATAAIGGAFAADGTAGRWTKKSFAVSGGWSITERDGGLVVILDDDFETRSAPDLKIVLSPASLADLGNGNALDGGLIVAPLRSATGAQEYRLPPGTDLSRYRTILIHCEQYSKLWAGAALR